MDPATIVATLADARRHVEDDLARMTRDMAALVAASQDSNADDEHDPEGPTIAYERSQLAALTRQAQQHLAELDAALARLENGTYGVCESCGAAIGSPRLEARPASRLCLECANRDRRRA